MEKVKLTKSPLEVLEVELPDGEKLILKIKNPTVNESDQMQRDLIALDLRLNKKDKDGNLTPELTNTAYSLKTMQIICEEFDLDIVGNLEIGHLGDIADAVTKLQKKANERKKKERSSLASKNSKSGVTE